MVQRKNYNPRWWGPGTWRFLHSVSEGLPEVLDDDIESAMEDLVRALPLLLPCKKCRTHLAESYKNDMPSGKTREDCVLAFQKLHDIVNKSLAKDGLSENYASHEISESGSMLGFDYVMAFVATAAIIVLILLFSSRKSGKSLP